MARWTAFPYDAAPYRRDADSLARLWPRLHAGDAEPVPAERPVFAAWALFHAGEFRRARDAGLKAGAAGITVANKAQCLYASYLEKSEAMRTALLLEVAERAAAQQREQPACAAAHFWQAYALGRYAQSVSVSQALADGLIQRVKAGLEATVALAPRHADAHIALGVFHADVIDKVGRLLARAQGADATLAVKMFRRALELNPASPIARIEYANALVMLDGQARMAQAESLYLDAAACEPMDAVERLEMEMARAELEDE